ncbi:coiled-coil domain-containing protein [Hamadaea tsunoensis]|uniref:coiled-coil domain-containing protein n=1 Tax=Hamadaea tsunoensis TaxID=53368 RepID=UPI00040F6982|nr:hypothetical protein [Hamadaea tsunoensis]
MVTPGRRLLAVLTVLLSLAFFAADPAAAAAPGDSEGGTAKLRTALDEATRGYLDAKNALAASQAKQKDLTSQLTTLQTRYADATKAVGQVADAAYRSGRLGTISALLGSNSPEEFIERAYSLNAVAVTSSGKLKEMTDARDRVTTAKAEIEAAIADQQKQVQVMAARKKQAEDALIAAGGGASVPGFGGLSKTATPAPRNSDGSWPKESCSVDDPTTSGCITPRTLHAMQEAKKAGFTHYVSCYRPSGEGEHPKGRACDFAAAKTGFEGVASGADKTYGTNLANFFIKNADNLGVLYVIWFRRIWLPGSGWKSYSGCCDPAATHENHVHLSMY